MVANPVDSETIEVEFPSGFPAQEIVIYLIPEDGFPPELFDVEIVACLSEYISMVKACRKSDGKYFRNLT